MVSLVKNHEESTSRNAPRFCPYIFLVSLIKKILYYEEK